MITLSLIFVAIIVLREYTIAREREEWLGERRELLNRIQAPERLPAAQIADFTIPEVEPDEFELVGSIKESMTDE